MWNFEFLVQHLRMLGEHHHIYRNLLDILSFPSSVPLIHEHLDRSDLEFQETPTNRIFPPVKDYEHFHAAPISSSGRY